jgi:hypothetical protein
MRSKLRLTRQQKAYQEGIIAGFDLGHLFKPCSNLAGYMAEHIRNCQLSISMLNHELEAEKKKSISAIVWDRYFTKPTTSKPTEKP